MKNLKNILITGASSGLGAALAQHYAAPGVTLHLQGRNAQRLEKITENCRVSAAVAIAVWKNPRCHRCELPMHGWLTAANAITPNDLIIANAGISAGTGIHGEDGKQVRDIFAGNIDGVVHTVSRCWPP